MPSNYEKLSRPSGPSIDTLALPEKAAFSTNTTVCPDDTPRMSTTSTPRSDRSTNPFDTDIEAMVPTHTTDSSGIQHKTSASPLARKSDCQVWPGKDHWKQKAKANKAKNRCTCMANLSRRNRIIVKVLMVFLVVGVAVGVGFGVSKPLNAPIWGDRDNKH
ncbi:hypothetical protein BHE90_014759 [Fusarium euwallaceae]|uniref:Uncharacterized protein n=4 Tax=Fusarium solani species complex TaxID=232080 RepID=A0A3M2RPA1_9HYPO|nr:hypothetical protein CDV36_013347 [Fusarium kuroshium]RSL43462.1 hypothetical protein CEP53_011685 [Fusarium sp. AF-6]RSL74803.1 hypothetical protein CEP51_011452 [Fusarium floridanum]RSM19895.1 hypothetical protein CDV31_001253 [Fusarium ambrosium]RTE70845.1 hypothetical protein BHE90_014759 [Fusarium euwallaceae]